MKHYFLNYPPITLQRARKLRRNATSIERACWELLRRKALGVAFRRQVPFGPYIMDFCCVSLRLAIELDGEEHRTEEGLAYDDARDKYLADHGLKVLRFSNEYAQVHWKEMVEIIRSAIEEQRKCLGAGAEGD